MYKHKLYTLALLTLVVFTSACDKWLYLEPQDAIVRQQFWKTKEQAEAALIGCYASLLDGDLTYKMFAWGELRADMILPNPTARLDELEITNGNIIDINPITDWSPFYRTINYCNTVIEFAPQVKEHDPTFQDEVMNSYVAEARAIRSLMYFYLVRSFGEVPLKVDATVSDDQDFTLPKSSKEEVLQFILNDLRLAEEHAMRTFGRPDYNKGRFTKYGINALQADVYLWSEKYDSCIIACDKIIASGQFGLVAGNANWYQTLFAQGNSNEGIFEIQFGAQQHPFFSFIRNQRRFGAAPHVLEELYTIDYTDPDNADIRAEGASVRADGQIWKYIGMNGSNTRVDAAPYPNWIVYRYAEILLFKAEALAQLGQGQEALDLLYTVRERANALPGSDRGADASNIQEVTEFILEERAREFAYEGKRWFDVLRNAKRNNYENLYLLIDMAVRSAPPDRQQTIVNKYRDYDSHYLPIFQQELLTNKNLVQNPFYLK